jgi:sterol O-acyltransferase
LINAAFIMYQSWCKGTIENLEKYLDLQALASTIINLMLPSMLFLVMGFFGFLHSWMNLWAEITRFPDRAFYSDWWNSP